MDTILNNPIVLALNCGFRLCLAQYMFVVLCCISTAAISLVISLFVHNTIMSYTLITDDSCVDVQKFDTTESSIPAKLAPKLTATHTCLQPFSPKRISSQLHCTRHYEIYALPQHMFDMSVGHLLSFLVSFQSNTYTSYQ